MSDRSMIFTLSCPDRKASYPQSSICCSKLVAASSMLSSSMTAKLVASLCVRLQCIAPANDALCSLTEGEDIGV